MTRSRVRSHGGQIIEWARVTDPQTDDPVRVTTVLGEVTASQVVLATGIPFLDRGLYFAKVQPSRSYVQAFRTS